MDLSETRIPRPGGPFRPREQARSGRRSRLPRALTIALVLALWAPSSGAVVALGPPASSPLRQAAAGAGEQRADGRARRAPAAAAGASEPRRAAPPIPLRRVTSSGALEGFDLLLIVLDAARADAISSYGAERPTPAIDALANDGVRFERALSTAAWTAPAIGSLFTGLHPDAHGVMGWTDPVPARVPTLAEAFARAGYGTHLWSAHTLYRGNRSLRRGFERTTLMRVDERERLPSARALSSDGRPRLDVVHLLVPHAPYEPPRPHAGRYVTDPPTPDELRPENLRGLSRRPGVDRSHPVIRGARDRYDEMMAWADAQVGALQAALRQAGRDERTLIVLTADHGEAFLEHGHMLHTRDLHDEMIRVPLIFRWPAAAGEHRPAVVDETVGLVDVPASLVDLFGLRLRGRVHGRALFDTARRYLPSPRCDPEAADGDIGVASAYATARGPLGAAADRRPLLLALECGPAKLLLEAHSGKTRLYYPGRDPGESIDRSPERPGIVAALSRAAQLQRRADRSWWRRIDGAARSRPSAPVELEPEDARRHR